MAGSQRHLDSIRFVDLEPTQQWPLPGEDAEVGDTLFIRMPYVRIAPLLRTSDVGCSELHPAANPPPPSFQQRSVAMGHLAASPLGTVEADSLIVLVVPEGTTVIELRNAPLQCGCTHGPRHFQN